MTRAKISPIALYDSGRGVESVLRQCRRILPNERWLVLKDVNNQPYGCKSSQEIIEAGFSCFAQLMQGNIKAAVVACHTSSAIALPYLRKHFSVPIIGMLHPTAQLLAKQYAETDIFWLATPASVRANRFVSLARSYGYAGRIHAIACPDWVVAIESGCAVSLRRIIAIFIQKYGDQLRTGQYKILYGCTHYPLIEKWLKSEFTCPDLYIDPAEAVALALQKMLTQKNLLTSLITQNRGAVVSYIEPSSLFLRGVCTALVTT